MEHTRINPRAHWYGVTDRATVVRPGKNFFPGAPELPVDRYQQLLSGLGQKLLLGLQLMSEYGLSSLVRLGDRPLVQPADSGILCLRGPGAETVLERLSFSRDGKLSNYLYQNCIHPQFFVDSVHLLGTKAEELKEKVLEMRLRNLGRDHIARMFETGQLNTEDLNRGDFKQFAARPARERLAVLERLGVLIMKPEETFLPRQRDLFREV